MCGVSGSGATYAKTSAFSPAPPLVVTVTVTKPAACGGVFAVISVDETTSTSVAAMPPNSTFAPLSKFSPKIITGVPPPVDPSGGETPLTVTTTGTSIRTPTGVSKIE